MPLCFLPSPKKLNTNPWQTTRLVSWKGVNFVFVHQNTSFSENIKCVKLEHLYLVYCTVLS